MRTLTRARTLLLAVAVSLVGGLATSVAGQMAPGGSGAAALERRTGHQGQGAGLERCPEGHAAASRSEADLPNGLHLMVLEDHRLPRIAFQIIIPGAGGYFDPPAMIGLSRTPRR